jgi:UrcA family protein
MVLTATFLVATGVTVAGNQSHAAPTVDTASGIRVRFSDLDLSKPQDVATLYKRLRWAAWTVCEPNSSAHLESKSRFDRCVEQTTEDAIDQVNRPELTAFHREHTKGAGTGLKTAGLVKNPG